MPEKCTQFFSSKLSDFTGTLIPQGVFIRAATWNSDKGKGKRKEGSYVNRNVKVLASLKLCSKANWTGELWYIFFHISTDSCVLNLSVTSSKLCLSWKVWNHQSWLRTALKWFLMQLLKMDSKISAVSLLNTERVLMFGYTFSSYVFSLCILHCKEHWLMWMF